MNMLEFIMNTVLTHFYNEEYLLPWWINHHKKIFDNGIMINYHSTDRSVEICKDLCPPHWKIVNTVNATIKPILNDVEVKVYENSVEGFKMTLTIGEFLLAPCPLENVNLFMLHNNISYLKTFGVCMVDTDPDNLPTHDKSLIEQKHHGILTGYRAPLSMTLDPHHWWVPDPFNHLYGRYYHNQPFGDYKDGRHEVNSDKTFDVKDMFTLKYKYCPWNEVTLNRMKAFDVKKHEADEAYNINTVDEHNQMHKYFLIPAHDLIDDYSFKTAYHHCMSL